MPDTMPASSSPAPPETTPEDLVAKAKALRPLLLSQQEEAERRGRYSEEVHEEFLRAGFYHILTPRRYGGYEMDVPTFFRVMVEVSRGDPGTGWCLCLGCGHNLTLASHWPAKAQDEIFNNPLGYYRSPHRAPPIGTATPVADGYVINGTWDYSSGIPYASHFKGSALAPGEDGEPTAVVAVVPRGQYTVLEDWGNNSILGMQSSGSNTVVVKDVVVPKHWVVPFDWRTKDLTHGTPGTQLHGNPMYLGRVAGFYHGELVSTIVGAAKAALDEYERIITTKKTIRPPLVMRFEDANVQRDFGNAMSMVDSAEGLLLRAGELYMEYCRAWRDRGQDFTLEMDMRIYGMIQNAGRIACDATELAFRTASSSAAKRGERLQRYFRDVSMYRGHFSAQYLNTSQDLAKVHFGLPVPRFA